MITCPACQADIDIEEEDLDEGDLFDCTECGANLRVASLKPLDLVAVKDDASYDEDEEDEDYDDDEDEEEEEEDDDYEDELEEEEDEEEDDWN
jgi:alpha-aminoadipate/glutamate carrier protein LysW